MRIEKTILVLLGVLVSDPVPALAQDSTVVVPTLPTLPTLQPRPRVPVAAEAAPLLDAPVDRATYRLGAGDRLELGIFGAYNEQQPLTVSPDGLVAIAGVGVANVLGLTVDEAEARIRSLVGQLYRDVRVRLTLTGVRQFKVFVVGHVPRPGTVIATAATRVSELVDPISPEGMIRRNLTLRRRTGEAVRLDMVPFVRSGDLRSNPTVNEGDALVVPEVDATVKVFGTVFHPGTYEHLEGESLAEFLRVSNEGERFPGPAADSIRFTRFGPGGVPETRVLSRTDALGAVGRGILLQPQDAVFVPEVSNYRQIKVAEVQGEVMRPGIYPIRPDTTTLRDLVEMAGGFTPEAALINATLRRMPRVDVPVRPTPPEELVDSVLSPRERQVRDLTRPTGEPEFVVMDLTAGAREGRAMDNPTLQDGDILTVPEVRNEVTVLGAVLRPGIVPHRPGLTYLDYIALAGGLSRRADRGNVSIVRAGAGNLVEARDVWYPQPGDQVVIPFSPRRPFIERLQPVQTLVGLISSAVVAIAIASQ